MDEVDSLYANTGKKERKYTRCDHCGTFNKQDPGDICWTCKKGIMI